MIYHFTMNLKMKIGDKMKVFCLDLIKDRVQNIVNDLSNPKCFDQNSETVQQDIKALNSILKKGRIPDWSGRLSNIEELYQEKIHLEFEINKLLADFLKKLPTQCDLKTRIIQFTDRHGKVLKLNVELIYK